MNASKSFSLLFSLGLLAACGGTEEMVGEEEAVSAYADPNYSFSALPNLVLSLSGAPAIEFGCMLRTRDITVRNKGAARSPPTVLHVDGAGDIAVGALDPGESFFTARRTII